jgi:hypothetical protein
MDHTNLIGAAKAPLAACSLRRDYPESTRDDTDRALLRAALWFDVAVWWLGTRSRSGALKDIISRYSATRLHFGDRLALPIPAQLAPYAAKRICPEVKGRSPLEYANLTGLQTLFGAARPAGN